MAPIPICCTKSKQSANTDSLGFARRFVRPMVRKTAIGSLLPDSSSSKGVSFPERLRFLAPSTLNTAAASVAEIMPPNSNPSRNETWSRKTAKTATTMEVRSTPMVERAKAPPSVGRTTFHSVSNPPAKRMKARATTPTACATDALSK